MVGSVGPRTYVPARRNLTLSRCKIWQTVASSVCCCVAKDRSKCSARRNQGQPSARSEAAQYGRRRACALHRQALLQGWVSAGDTSELVVAGRVGDRVADVVGRAPPRECAINGSAPQWFGRCGSWSRAGVAKCSLGTMGVRWEVDRCDMSEGD